MPRRIFPNYQIEMDYLIPPNSLSERIGQYMRNVRIQHRHHLYMNNPVRVITPYHRAHHIDKSNMRVNRLLILTLLFVLVAIIVIVGGVCITYSIYVLQYYHICILPAYIPDATTLLLLFIGICNNSLVHAPFIFVLFERLYAN